MNCLLRAAWALPWRHLLEKSLKESFKVGAGLHAKWEKLDGGPMTNKQLGVLVYSGIVWEEALSTKLQLCGVLKLAYDSELLWCFM